MSRLIYSLVILLMSILRIELNPKLKMRRNGMREHSVKREI